MHIPQIERVKDDMTHTRFRALTPSYEAVSQVLPTQLQQEYTVLAEKITNMPKSYGGIGNTWIDGPLSDIDQATWDRYAEITTLGKSLLKAQGWTPEDPISTTLSGRMKLRALKTLGHSPDNFGVY